DLHWDQSRIGKVARHLAANMGRAVGKGDDDGGAAMDIGHRGDFRGAYAGQIALPIKADALRYVSTPAISVCEVRMLAETGAGSAMNPAAMYDWNAFAGVDPYSFFLGGPQPLIEITNPAAPEGELYLFRDSFASSLAPLLCTYYRKTTLIDLRYISSEILPDYIRPGSGAQILFLYNPKVLNQPATLRAPSN
ncbi:MAG: hypothetical protein LBD12_07670, partial [Clostridiales Family XIII bacterium]|nr:hypothetical protein [Clostridiales Family XIII bacterium]